MNSPFSRIQLTSSGGLANLRLADAMKKGLRGKDLPPELVQRLERILERGDLASASARRALLPLGAADTVQYGLTVETEDGTTQRFSFDELSVPSEVLDLVDDLKAAVLRHRRGRVEKE